MKEIQLKLMTAASISMQKHGDQLDDCGNNYFDAHVKQVASLIALVNPNDHNLIIAALLHDTIEDTNTTEQEIRSIFGDDVADLVMEVTHEGKKDSKGYYFPRLKTKRGILLKFADRLSNLSRMENWDEKRQNQYLRKSKFWKSE